MFRLPTSQLVPRRSYRQMPHFDWLWCDNVVLGACQTFPKMILNRSLKLHLSHSKIGSKWATLSANENRTLVVLTYGYISRFKGPIPANARTSYAIGERDALRATWRRLSQHGPARAKLLGEWRGYEPAIWCRLCVTTWPVFYGFFCFFCFFLQELSRPVENEHPVRQGSHGSSLPPYFREAALVLSAEWRSDVRFIRFK